MQFERQNRNSGRLLRIKIYFLFGLAVLVFVLGIALITNTSVFRFKDIKISGLERIDEASFSSLLRNNILDSAWKKVLGFNNLLLWNNKSLKLENYLLAQVLVNRNIFARELEISASERKPYIVWCMHLGSCVWVDDGGIILSEAKVSEGRVVDVIIDEVSNELSFGSQVIDAVKFNRLKKILNILKENQIMAKEEKYNLKNDEFTIRTFDDLSIYFSTRFDPLFTSSALKSLPKKINLEKVEYLDLRVENKIFYKIKT